MLESVVEHGKEGGKATHTFDFCRDAVASSQFAHTASPLRADVETDPDINVDDTFKCFYEFCEGNDIPVVIVSR